MSNTLNSEESKMASLALTREIVSHTASRRLDVLKARLIQAIEAAWGLYPARDAYEMYTDEIEPGVSIGEDQAEVIHDFTAQALASIMSNVLAEFDVIAEEKQLIPRLNLLEQLHLESRKVQSDYEREDSRGIAEDALREAKVREIDRLRRILSDCKQLAVRADKSLSEVANTAQLAIGDLSALRDENHAVADNIEHIKSVLEAE